MKSLFFAISLLCFMLLPQSGFARVSIGDAYGNYISLPLLHDIDLHVNIPVHSYGRFNYYDDHRGYAYGHYRYEPRPHYRHHEYGYRRSYPRDRYYQPRHLQTRPRHQSRDGHSHRYRDDRPQRGNYNDGYSIGKPRHNR